MSTIILDFGKHKINPVQIVRYRGEGDAAVRTKVVMSHGPAIYLSVSPDKFKQILEGMASVKVLKVELPEEVTES